MISICIPIYNLDVRELGTALEPQVKELGDGAELVFIDDASDSAFRHINAPMCQRYTCVQLEENVGRARIRNLFLKHAKNEYLLFLDCDSRIIAPDFLRRYRRLLEEAPREVVCGGSVYADARPPRPYRLRWKNGRVKETRSLEERREAPHRSFMTNNFLAGRRVMEDLPFDEKLVKYGHEDTLFGFRLKQAGVEVFHLENPVENGNLDRNRAFLSKLKDSSRNLLLILEQVEEPAAFVDGIRLLQVFVKLRQLKLEGLFRACFLAIRPLLYVFLVLGPVSLRLLDAYKLGTLLVQARELEKAG